LTDRRARDERSLPLGELINRRITDGFGQRKLAREVESMADAVAARLAAVGWSDRAGLADNERRAALAAVVDAFSAVVDSDNVLFSSDLDATMLASLIRSSAADVPVRAGLNDAGRRLFDVVLDECCVAFVQAVLGLGPFPSRASAEILSRLSGQGDLLAQLLARLPVRSLDAPAGTQDDDEFRHRYLTLISAQLDDLELFGVDTRRFRPRSSLSVAYVSLTVSVDGAGPNQVREASQRWAQNLSTDHYVGDVPSEDSSASMRVEQALGQASRTLIRGEAGSGKTTVLRWLAITAARNGFTSALSDWNGSVPFLVRLRSFAGRRLPRPDQLLDDIASPMAGLTPAGWVHRQFDSGQVLLLIDGVDELAAAQRSGVRDWLRSLLATFPLIKVVATSRPAAASARWLSGEGFAPAMLERMGYYDVRALVNHWHQAVRDAPDLPCSVDELPRYQSTLLARLDANTHLRSLATSPLLCAMLCALNLDRRTHLPRDRMSLYAAAVDLLLERRDAERHLPAAALQIDGRDKLQLLQHVAWRLSINNRSETSRANAILRIGGRLAAMPQIDADPEAVYEHLLHRSGIIREPAVGRMDFIHRTFQEYLTAREAAEHGDTGLLTDKAHLDAWRQVVVMAAGHANTAMRAELLTGILDRAEAEPNHRRTLTRLAASCLETVPVLEPPALLERVQAAIDTLVPPRGPAEARSLAAVGEPLLRRLPADIAELPVGLAAATVRAAALVNGPDALDILANYAHDPRRPVQRQLLSAWEYFDPHEYARRVLADAALDDGGAWITNPALLPAAAHLRHLDNLAVAFHEPADLTDLESVPALQRLLLFGSTTTDLSVLRDKTGLWDLRINNEHVMTDPRQLVAVPQLKWLMFNHHRRITSLDFLESLTNLVMLVVDSVAGIRDFSALDHLPELVELALIGVTEQNLSKIPRLHELRLLCLPRAVAPLGGLAALAAAAPQLSHLEINHNDWVRDLAPLKSMPNLVTVCLRGTLVGDLRPLADMPHLRYIDLVDCPLVNDLSPLAELPHLRRVWVRELAPDTQLGRFEPRRTRRTRQESADMHRLSRGLNRQSESLRAMIVEMGSDRAHRATRQNSPST
jgi:hypothetical protein